MDGWIEVMANQRQNVLLPWKHKQINKRCLKNLGPLYFWLPANPTSARSCFSLSVLTSRTSESPELPADCLLQSDFTRVEEQAEPLMEALFPNGMKSSLGRTLHSSAERRDTSPLQKPHKNVGPHPAQLGRAIARLGAQIDAEKRSPSRPSFTPPFRARQKAHLDKMR